MNPSFKRHLPTVLIAVSCIALYMTYFFYMQRLDYNLCAQTFKVAQNTFAYEVKHDTYKTNVSAFNKTSSNELIDAIQKDYGLEFAFLHNDQNMQDGPVQIMFVNKQGAERFLKDIHFAMGAIPHNLSEVLTEHKAIALVGSDFAEKVRKNQVLPCEKLGIDSCYTARVTATLKRNQLITTVGGGARPTNDLIIFICSRDFMQEIFTDQNYAELFKNSFFVSKDASQERLQELINSSNLIDTQIVSVQEQSYNQAIQHRDAAARMLIGIGIVDAILVVLWLVYLFKLSAQN